MPAFPIYDFTGKTAFVSGAGGGMGHAIASTLLSSGADVVAFDIKPDPQDFPPGPGALTYVQGDITDGGTLAAAFGSFRNAQLSFIVNAAGIILWDDDGSIVDIDMDVWTKTLEINLMAAVHTARLGIPIMRKTGGGSIVNIASVVGLRTAENGMEAGAADSYQVSKAALISLSKGLALAQGKHGIRSNTICPGAVWTPMTDAIYEDPARIEAMEDRTPSHTIGRPEDIAQACMFLLSDAAAFITGTDLVVDGGLSAKLG